MSERDNDAGDAPSMHDESDAVRRIVEAGADPDKPAVVLRLYVIGNAPVSSRAIANTRRLCEEHLAGRYKLEIVDLQEQPGAAMEADVVAAPTLVKTMPPPLRRFIGDMSRTEHVLVSLDIA